MSRGINKVILIGHLGSDPEVRYLTSGSPVSTLRIATSESWKDKQTGQMQEKTEWHRVVFFNRLAEVAAQYLKKGSKVYVEGSLRTQKWQDKTTGQDRYTTEIVGSNMQMLDARGQAGGGDGFGSPPVEMYDDQASAPSAGASPYTREQSPGSATTPAMAEEGIEDDIPF